MTNPLVGIVIPVYNGEAHLAECLQSVLNQSYDNWQAVVVNNCSTDGTAGIADEFARQDDRLTVLHCTEFLDQAGNYNRAIESCPREATYLKLLEADNWITPSALAQLIEAGESFPDAGIIGSYWLDGTRVLGSGVGYERRVMSGHTAARLMYVDRKYLFGTPTTLLYRRTALVGHSPCFKSTIFYDDIDLCLRVLRSWQFAFVHQILAFVRNDNAGIHSTVVDHDYEPALRYFLLRVYGADYFSSVDLATIESAVRRHYYACLAKALLRRKPASYWTLHRSLFALHNEQLRLRSLLSPLLHEFAQVLLNPLSSAIALQQRVARRFTGESR
jgi:glycosyltransferase involved in cell wall biosynthesis